MKSLKKLLVVLVLSLTALVNTSCELYGPSARNASEEAKTEARTILSDAGDLVKGYSTEISSGDRTSLETLDANVIELKDELEIARDGAKIESVKVRIEALEDHIDQTHGEFRDLLIHDNPALNEEKSIQAFWDDILEKITEISEDK